jgi:hypothetical protein
MKQRLRSGRATALETAAAEDSIVSLKMEMSNFLIRWCEKVFDRALAQRNWNLAVSFFEE